MPGFGYDRLYLDYGRWSYLWWNVQYGLDIACARTDLRDVFEHFVESSSSSPSSFLPPRRKCVQLNLDKRLLITNYERSFYHLWCFIAKTDVTLKLRAEALLSPHSVDDGPNKRAIKGISVWTIQLEYTLFGYVETSYIDRYGETRWFSRDTRKQSGRRVHERGM